MFKNYWKHKNYFEFQGEYWDCGIDTDLLQTFSRYLNLRLIFIEPNVEDTGKLGVKVDGKWINGSMALLYGKVIQVNRSESSKF